MQKILDVVEKVGNLVPHPVIIFLILVGIVLALSHFLHLAGTNVSYEMIVPKEQMIEPIVPTDYGDYDAAPYYHNTEGKKYSIEKRVTAIRSLLTTEGIRFMDSSLIPSFMGFTAVGLMIVAMVGAGVAELSGLVTAMIRMLALISPR